MKEDYRIYGDVMVFDMTYRTNKYNLWLFEVFKKSMRGKCPITLFTDQDQAIATAITKVFPQTRHRLCLWHLQQNVVSRFSQLKSNNKALEEQRTK
ncbi:protein FAR1-RELATED SEQUENCE 4-like isoform X6 [Primulina huaijiensis]|uniref:protein FAR1-RELATED SEQUENCE 4-like isoform X6 n=1 Tax=Primulina huaijiensis TaxID=1492673 RepID=UPI003CC73E2B